MADGVARMPKKSEQEEDSSDSDSEKYAPKKTKLACTLDRSMARRQLLRNKKERLSVIEEKPVQCAPVSRVLTFPSQPSPPNSPLELEEQSTESTGQRKPPPKMDKTAKTIDVPLAPSVASKKSDDPPAPSVADPPAPSVAKKPSPASVTNKKKQVTATAASKKKTAPSADNLRLAGHQEESSGNKCFIENRCEEEESTKCKEQCAISAGSSGEEQKKIASEEEKCRATLVPHQQHDTQVPRNEQNQRKGSGKKTRTCCQEDKEQFSGKVGHK